MWPGHRDSRQPSARIDHIDRHLRTDRRQTGRHGRIWAAATFHHRLRTQAPAQAVKRYSQLLRYVCYPCDTPISREPGTLFGAIWATTAGRLWLAYSVNFSCAAMAAPTMPALLSS